MCRRLGCEVKVAGIWCNVHDPKAKHQVPDPKHEAKHASEAKHPKDSQDAGLHDFASDGSRGGISRAKKLSPQRRKQIASDAAKARWAKRG